MEKSRENYLRVTTMLKPFSGLENVDQELLDYKAEIGTRVHKICEGIVLGIGEIGVDDEVWGYVESFKKWWGEGKDVICTEKRFWNDDILLTGQVDMIIKNEPNTVIIDLKTSSKSSKTWPVQASAYGYLALLEGYNIQFAEFIQLNKHGKDPKIHKYEINSDLFISVYETYKHFYQKDKE